MPKFSWQYCRIRTFLSNRCCEAFDVLPEVIVVAAVREIMAAAFVNGAKEEQRRTIRFLCGVKGCRDAGIHILKSTFGHHIETAFFAKRCLSIFSEA